METTDLIIQKLNRLTLNTPWKALFMMLREDNDESTMDIISYYMIKLYGIDDINSLLEYSEESTSSKAASVYSMSSYGFHEGDGEPPMDSRNRIASKLMTLVSKLMVQYACKINETSEGVLHHLIGDTAVDTYLNGNDKYTRYYKGTPKGGVSIYRCTCCDNIFAVHDSLIPSKETARFMNSVYIDAYELPICEFCKDAVIDAMYSKNIATRKYLQAVVGIKEISVKPNCISIAPPDNTESGTPAHSYMPKEEDTHEPDDAE